MLEKWGKHWKSQGVFSVRKSENHDVLWMDRPLTYPNIRTMIINRKRNDKFSSEGYNFLYEFLQIWVSGFASSAKGPSIRNGIGKII